MTSRGQTNRGTAKITYWVWTSDSPELTFFQGFRRSHIESTPILKHITTFPSTVFELFVNRSRAAFARVGGVSAYEILILDQSHLEGLKLYPASPFSVFISDSSTWNAVENYKRSSPYPFLHATTSDQPITPQLATLGRAELGELYAHVMNFLEKSGELEMVLLPKPNQEFAKWEAEALELPERDHGITVPNEMALRSLGFQLGKLDPLPGVVYEPGGSASAGANSHIIRALRESVEALRTQKARLCSPHQGPPAGPPIETVIWAAGTGSHLPDTIPESASRPEGLTMMLRALLRQRDYPTFTNLSPDHLKKMFASKQAGAAITMRKLELELCAGALGVLAAGHLAAVIRIRPAVNLVRGQMKQIAACGAANGPRKTSKISKLAHSLGHKLSEEIGDDCMDMIEQAGEGIKLVSNAPLEFLPIRGLPLQLRRTVSRLPVTPGDVFLSHLIGIPNIYLSPLDLKTILIIRSFEDGDPIRDALSTASQEFLASAKGKLELRIADVRSATEFVEALNSFGGQIVIFDGHGTHDVQLKTGSLQLGRHSVHPLELAGKIRRMPPIVVLSACTTHPLEWSDGSTAIGFLLLGAISVLATITPISALDAAIFTGRLMLRLADFVPLIAGSGQRWSDVITGLLRMAYVTDVLRSFESRGWLSEKTYLEIHYQANIAINSGKRDWFEEVISSVSRRAGIPPSEVEQFWKSHAYFTSILQYVHLGSPEKITIVKDHGESASAGVKA
jgi:hypothetical protein